MANLNIVDFKDILLSKSGGKPLSKVQNFYSLLYQAMIKTKSNVDFPSSIRTVQLTNPVYTDVNLYQLPLDISLNGIINLRAIVPDTSYYDFQNVNARQAMIESKFYQQSNDSFRFIAQPRLAIRYKNGVPYLFLDIQTTNPVLLNACDSLTENGTVTTFGTASDVKVDTLQKVTPGGSLSFTVNAGANNGIDIDGFEAADLTEQNDFLAYVYLPTTTNVTGVTFYLGQSITQYYTGSITTDFFGNALTTGWNLIRIPFEDFSVGTGFPTWDNVTFARYRVEGTFTTAIEGFRLDSMVGQVGALYEIDYYSDYNFVNQNGAYILKPNADTDSIALSTADEQDIFTDQFIEIMTIDLKQSGSAVDYQEYGGKKLIDKYDNFKFKYPSMRQLTTTQYHNRPNLDTLGGY